MNRFFVDDIRADRFPLPQSITHQVRRVLRLSDGDEIVLLDGHGIAVRCRLQGGDCEVLDRGVAGGEPAHRLTVWQALLKGDHLEPVIRHGTELGIARFALFTSERSVARGMSSRKLERLRTVAREAAEQSERGMVPQIDEPVTYAEVLEAAAPGSVLLAERHEGRRLAELEPPHGVIIGPEGGFERAEVDAAQHAGLAIAGLGTRILRSETVAVAVAAVILSRTGDFA